MSEKQLQQIKTLDSRQLPVRAGLIALVLLALVFGWFSIRWQFGNMLAELTSPNDANAKEIAALAHSLSPSDPTANWLVASSRKNIFTPEAISATSKSFETVARLSPNEYRWWIHLGRAREQAEEIEAAEKAFLRGVEIAPSYIFPRWQLGNFYLRQNRSEEAFAELKKAAATNSLYRDQIFSLAWDYYEKDTARLEELAGNSASVKAGLAKFYASKQRAEDSLRIWNSLSPEERTANAVIAKIIAQAFYEKRIFRQSQEFVRDLGIEPDARKEIVQNGSFENPFGDANSVYFGWRVIRADKIEIKFDPTQKREGSRSLRVSFSGYADPTLATLNQYVTVEPSSKYRLSFWMRTENLKSGGTPALEIYNANDDKPIMKSESFPTGTHDWQQIKMEFTAPSNAEAVGVRTVRDFCGTTCPIFGVFWYDDFKLEKLK